MSGKRYLALDIGNRNIKAVCGGVGKGGFVEISEYDIADTPSGAIKDGKIVNPGAVADAVSEMLKRNRIREKKLILNITGTGVITRDIQVPRASEEEIEKMLEYEAQQYFPVDLENYVLDFKILEEIITPDSSTNRILLVAAPIKQIDEYMKVAELLKADIHSIDVHVNCVSKFLFGLDFVKPSSNFMMDNIPKEFAVLDIGSETTGVCIYFNGNLKFNRFLLNGSSEIDKYISNEYNMDFKEAERKKMDSGYVVWDDDEPNIPAQSLAISGAVKPAVDNLIGDINRFFEFYSSRGIGGKLQKIYICGGGSRLKGLDKYFSSYYNCPVELLAPHRNIFYSGKKSLDIYRDYPLLVNTIGAIIR